MNDWKTTRQCCQRNEMDKAPTKCGKFNLRDVKIVSFRRFFLLLLLQVKRSTEWCNLLGSMAVSLHSVWLPWSHEKLIHLLPPNGQVIREAAAPKRPIVEAAKEAWKEVGAERGSRTLSPPGTRTHESKERCMRGSKYNSRATICGMAKKTALDKKNQSQREKETK